MEKEQTITRRALEIKVDERRTRGRLKETWFNTIKHNLKKHKLRKNLDDCMTWRHQIHAMVTEVH